MNKLRDINLFSIIIFVKVYESLNAQAVATALQVPPSKISRSLGTLRHALNDVLFIRRQYGFEPTPMADRLYPYFQQMLSILDTVENTTTPSALKPHKHYTLLAPATLTCRLGTALKARAEQEPGKVSLTIKTMSNCGCDDLVQGQADLMLNFKASDKSRLTSRLIASGELLFVIANEKHPIWRCPPNQMLDNIIQYPFLITECPFFNDRIDPLELYAIDQGRRLDVIGNVDSLSEVTEYIENSDAVTFVGLRVSADYLAHFPGIKAQQLNDAEFEKLHKRAPPPNYYLVTRNEDDELPKWLIDEISGFIASSVQKPARPTRDTESRPATV